LAKKAFVYDGTNWVDIAQSTADLTNYANLTTNQPTFRNVFINGGFAINQRTGSTSQTITAGAALAYTVDRWYAYCTGANITGARVAGTAPSQYYYRLTGAASNTAVGFGQRIEAANCFHLAGQNVTLGINLASTSLTSITWTAYYANTTDTFGTLASPTRTQIATGTFAVTSTLGRKTATFTVPSAATTGIEIVFTGGALLGSQTLTFDDAQLELGSIATPFEQRPISTELALCQRYYEKSYDIDTVPGTSTGNGAYWGDHSSHGDNTSLNPIFFKVTKRISNYTASFYTTGGTLGSWDYARNGASGTATVVLYGNGQNGMGPYISIGAAWAVCLRYGHWVVNAEL
jgi:hypothetical protein